MKTQRLKRVVAGCVELPDGRQLVRTEWTGPRGGRRSLWEMVEHEPAGWTIVAGEGPWATLREARADLLDRGVIELPVANAMSFTTT